ncbi:MAG: hypothetical protein HRT53_01785 [Colwellia sp.]|nr:hypothetical protein [Colwellia sp.]
MKSSLKIIYGLIILIALQSVLSIDKYHLDADNHTELTTHSIQDSADVLTQLSTSESEDLHELDCHKGHCHHASTVYLALNSNNIIIDVGNAKVSQITFAKNSPLISPDLRPPIV